MSKKLQQSLGDWRASATDVKSRIYNETIHRVDVKKRKPFILKFAVTAAVLAIGITGTALLLKDAPSSQPPTTSIGAPNVTEEANVVAYRTINENYLAIAQYELFYRSQRFYTVEQVQFYALNDAIDKYAYINYLASYNYVWSEQDEDVAYRMIEAKLNAEFSQPATAAYYEKMFEELSITKETYINDYLLVIKEYDALQFAAASKKIVTQDDYDLEKAKQEFMNRSGLNSDYLNYLASRTDDMLEPIEPQPKLSFLALEEDEYSFLEIARDLEGEYIFTRSNIETMDLPNSLSTYLYTLRAKVNGEYDNFFTRFNYEQIKGIVQKDAQNGMDVAKKMLDFFVVFERTVDWHFEPNTYTYNVIPTFELASFRKHNERTLKIKQHEYFYREMYSENAHAYQMANNFVVDLFATFNYLAQSFGITLTSETQQHYKDVAKERLAKQLQDPIEVAYFEKLLKDLGITEQQYIDDYLALVVEYETLQARITQEKLGLDEDGRYPHGEQKARYRETANFTFTEMYQVTQDLAISPVSTYLEPQPTLSIDLNPEFELELYENEQGEYVYAYLGFFELYLTEAQSALLESIRTKLGGHILARYSIDFYLAEVNQLTTKVGSDLAELLSIYKTTLAQYE